MFQPFKQFLSIILITFLLFPLNCAKVSDGDDESEAKSYTSIQEAKKTNQAPTFYAFSHWVQNYSIVDDRESGTTMDFSDSNIEPYSLKSLVKNLSQEYIKSSYLEYLEHERKPIADLVVSLKNGNEAEVNKFIEEDAEALYDIVMTVLSDDHQMTSDDLWAKAISHYSREDKDLLFQSFLAPINDKVSLIKGGLATEKDQFINQLKQNYNQDESSRKKFLEITEKYLADLENYISIFNSMQDSIIMADEPIARDTMMALTSNLQSAPILPVVIAGVVVASSVLFLRYKMDTAADEALGEGDCPLTDLFQSCRIFSGQLKQ